MTSASTCIGTKSVAASCSGVVMREPFSASLQTPSWLHLALVDEALWDVHHLHRELRRAEVLTELPLHGGEQRADVEHPLRADRGVHGNARRHETTGVRTGQLTQVDVTALEPEVQPLVRLVDRDPPGQP